MLPGKVGACGESALRWALRVVYATRVPQVNYFGSGVGVACDLAGDFAVGGAAHALPIDPSASLRISLTERFTIGIALSPVGAPGRDDPAALPAPGPDHDKASP